MKFEIKKKFLYKWRFIQLLGNRLISLMEINVGSFKWRFKAIYV